MEQGVVSRCWQGGVGALSLAVMLLSVRLPPSRRERGTSVLPMHGVVFASDETGKVL